MASYICANCRYRFKSSEENAKLCPYCGKRAAEKEKSADELIDEIKIE